MKNKNYSEPPDASGGFFITLSVLSAVEGSKGRKAAEMLQTGLICLLFAPFLLRNKKVGYMGALFRYYNLQVRDNTLQVCDNMLQVGDNMFQVTNFTVKVTKQTSKVAKQCT